jgi:ribose 5-phosphate isomerase B
MTKKIIVAVGSDHAGFSLKESAREFLKEWGYEVFDAGTHTLDSVDYPDFAKIVAKGVSQGKYDRGVLVCGTGIGMSICANKFKNVRAALVTSNFHAEMAARHNNANILVFGGRVTSPMEARIMLKTWLETPFEGDRHTRRVEKIDKITE